MQNQMNNTFEEQQSFFTWWLSLLLLLIVGITVVSAWLSRDSDAWIAALVGLGVALGVTALLFSTRLRSRIDAQGIHVRFVPFIIREKTWGWEDLQEGYVRRDSLWDYGGWGDRYSGAGTAYTTKGHYGMQMVLQKRNKRILIGTQHPEELQKVIPQYKRDEK